MSNFKTDKLIIVHNSRICITNFGTVPSALKNYLTEFDIFRKRGREVRVPNWTAVHHTMHPLYGEVICLPRNMDISVVTKHFPTHRLIIDLNCYIPYKTISINAKHQPRDVIQQEALNYLEGRNNYSTYRDARQQSLFLQTGMGKTFITIQYITSVKLKTIIIVHKDTLITQWKERIAMFSDVTDDEIGVIKGKESFKKVLKDKDSLKIVIASNKTLGRCFVDEESTTDFRDFMRSMEFGLKVIDECHINPKITFKIESETNVFKNLYLTATPKRSDFSSEKLLLKLLPEKSNSFGLNIQHRNSAYHNVEYVHIRSSPNEDDIKALGGTISIDKYSNYILNRTFNKVFDVVCDYIDDNMKHLNDNKKQIGVICGNLDLVTHMIDNLKLQYPNEDIGNYTSLSNDKSSELKKKVIVTTSMSMDAGDDSEFDILINLVPLSSEPALEQIIGRIRNKPNGKFLYVDVTDIGISANRTQYARRAKMLNTKLAASNKIVMK